jgi:Ca-activated chloride channel family protein
MVHPMGDRLMTARWIHHCLLVGLVLVAVGCGVAPRDVFLTADQRGERAFLARDFNAAATLFQDPMWRGTALYRAERFGEALDQFARVDTAASWFARGNALAHLEHYEEAITAYERALELDPTHPGATANISYLEPFLPLNLEGGVTGTVGRDGAADEVVYDADADQLAEQGRDTTTQDGMLSEDQLADLWLQQVDTSPAAFLRAKFRAQAAREDR